MKRHWLLTGAALLAGLSGSGCAYGPDRVDAQFGNAARNVIAAQRFVPPTGAAVYNGEGIDAVKAQQAYRAYQGDTGEPKNVNAQVLKIELDQ